MMPQTQRISIIKVLVISVIVGIFLCNTAKNEGLLAGFFLIAASDKHIAAYYGDSQELIVFERMDADFAP